MQAWAKDQRLGLSKIQLLGDPTGDFTRALGLLMDHPGPASKGIIGRCKRHALFVDDGVVKIVKVSETLPDDPAGDADPSATLSDSMLQAIQAL